MPWVGDVDPISIYREAFNHRMADTDATLEKGHLAGLEAVRAAVIKECVKVCEAVARKAHAEMMRATPGASVARHYAHFEDGALQCMLALREGNENG